MGRKRSELDEARLRTLMGQGWTAQAIADDFVAAGVTVSRATVDGRMRALRGHVATPRAPGPPPTAPASGKAVEAEVLPTEEDIENAAKKGPIAVAETLERITRLGRKAETEGNLSVVGRLLSLELQAQALLEKLTPPPAPDPNASPDMVKKGAEVEARFFKAIDLVLEGAGEDRQG